MSNFSSEIFHSSRHLLIQRVETWASSDEENLLIIEDTNHLKSLVKPFRTLCQVYLIPFIHLVLRVPLALALDRNERRVDKVPQKSLEKIWKQINDEKFFIESLEIDSEMLDLAWLMEKIRTAQVPLKQNPLTTKSEAGFKHLLDCKLRKAIKQTLDKFEGNKKAHAKKLIALKSSILKNLKKPTFHEYQEILNQGLTEMSKVS